MNRFPVQTAITISTIGCLLGAAPLVKPRLAGLRLSQFAALTDFTPERTPLSPLVARAPALPPRPSLLDDSHGALDSFYKALRRTEKRTPGAVTRIVHYGDSPTTADLITGDIRAMLQQRFGDAGHGFILVAKPWAWYQHRGVELSGSGWRAVPASRFGARDGFFGLGGVSFTSGASARTRIVLGDPGQSSFELSYLREPGGGAVTISANGHEITSVSTQGDVKSPGFTTFTVAGGASELDLRPAGGVRVFGLTAEKPGPGVVYDSLGLNGASITVLSRMFELRHWTEELRHRNPDLVVINYGTNEADFAAFIDSGYEKELREAIRRVRQALPRTSILMMSPMDRGHRATAGDIETMETIPRLVEIQRRVARQTGCAFFDTFAAMGGAGTMARWYTAQPRLVSADLIHPYPAAGKQIASIFVREIEAGLARFKLR
jgi:lysophospholipase L1-like esterase